MAEETSTAADLVRARERVLAAAPALQALSPDERAEQIATAAARLGDDGDRLGRALRAQLAKTTGLDRSLIEWGLATTLARFSAPQLRALHAGRPQRAGLVAAVLAGNVFSAAARPILLALLCGRPLLVKASSRDDALPRAIEGALREHSPRLADACAVLGFARTDADLEDELLREAQTLVVYGSDATVDTLGARYRELAPAGSARERRLVAHGHGFGLAFVEARATRTADTAGLLARDVIAYEQFGCLSPHAVLVEGDAERFAGSLFEALCAAEARYPPARLDPSSDAELLAAQRSWRAVAAVRGQLRQTPSCAVSYEDTHPLRASCGHRHIGVYRCRDVGELRARLAPLQGTLKALGIAASDDVRAALSPLAPYVCPLGEMQDPPLDAQLDRLHPLEGF